ncbi:ABC transporter permease [Streptomyces griseus]|uniref:ABC transporter permease protein n=10 Tax=Streptomyces TaxID=1883 RepID=B1VWE3_STRGG|nr:putative ABC transporter permease protein [Streptomyces griseus subsp. griseus NBRC 13350]SED53502.1 putative ABC transport system permease protein [Streptomyces griseus]SQA24764.1 ABC transporter permease [Streptomyces griseus]
MKRRTSTTDRVPSRARGRRTGAADREPLGVRQGSRRASAFLARRSLATHRRAWAAVIVATGAAAALIGAFAFVVGSLLVAAPPVQRYAGADAVVAADQKVSHTAKPWGGEPRTATAYLPERARLDRSVLAAVAGADGVARAVADDSVPLSTGDGRTAVGRSWPSAVLTRYELAEGRAPGDAAEVVLDAALAAGGHAPGDRIVLRAGGAARTYTVSGIARTGHGGDAPPAVFFTEPRLTALAGHPGRIDAIGVVAEPGVPADALRAAVGAVLPERSGVPGSDRGVRVLTGAERGEAEHVDALGGRGDRLALLGSIGGTVLMVALLVIASTLSQAIHQRSGELALLRAVGASPRQLRSAIGREAGRVAAAAALLGGVGAVPLGLAMRSLLTTGPLPLPVPWWLPPAAALTGGLLVALSARPVAMLAARSITRLRPAAALGAATADEPSGPGRFRTVAGVVLAFAGISSAGVATTQSGQAAGVAASGAAMSLVIAVALLGPRISRIALGVLGRPLRRAGGAPGFLAERAASAHTRRLAAAFTPIVLVVAFVCVQLASGPTMERAAGQQASAALRADLVATGGGAGLPAGAARTVREVPGVRAATGVLRSTVVLADREAGEPVLTRLPVLGVEARGLSGTLDPGVTAGDLDRLRGRDAVAVGADRAKSLDVGLGDRVALRLGDGTRVEPKVVAVYEHQLGVGEFLFPRKALAGHVSAARDQVVLIRTGDGAGADPAAAVREALAPYGGGVAVRAATGDDVAIAPPLSDGDNAMIVIGVGVIGGFALLAVVSTLALITIGRRGEFRLLRMVGTGRRQLRRMLVLETGLVTFAGLVIGTAVAAVPLTAFAVSLAGTAPYLPPAHYGVIAGAVALAAAAGTLVPGASAGGRSVLTRSAR